MPYNRTGEAAICARAAEQYPQNYHAWTHRQRVLRLQAPTVEYVGVCGMWQELGAGTDADAQVQGELAAMRDWARLHVSDHSGLHYRQVLLTELERHVHNPRRSGLKCATCVTSMLYHRLDRSCALRALSEVCTPAHMRRGVVRRY